MRPPMLHTWSLAVEEQFYVVWPVVLMLAAALASTGADRARVWVIVVAGMSIGSFLVAQGLTTQDSPLAFYSAVSRAWEFGAGALLCLAMRHRSAPLPGPVRGALTGVAVALFAAGLLVIDSTTPFPGTAALLPVVATVSLIAAAPTDPLVGGVLRSRPANAIGHVSYSWYLWHWPFIVIGGEIIGSDDTAARSLLALASLGPALLSYRFVENPVRFDPRLSASPRRSVAVLACFVAATAATISWAWIRTDRTLDEPLLAALQDAQQDRTDVVRGCAQLDPERILTSCAGGERDDPVGRVLLLGDSHGAQWRPAVDTVAAQLDLEMLVSVKGNCPTIAAVWQRQSDECSQRQRQILPLIDQLQPDLVVISHSVGYLGGLTDASGRVVGDSAQVDVWGASLEEFAGELSARDVGLVVVLDTPRFAESPLHCAAKARSAEACALPAADFAARLGRFHDAERAAIDAAGHGTFMDPNGRLCDASGCAVLVDGIVAYTDAHHLTATMAADFAPSMERAIRVELEAG